MAFSFQVTADPSIDPSLIKDANFALEQWSNVLDGKGTLVVDLQVTTGLSAGRADQVLTYAPTDKFDDGRQLFLPSAAFELTTGQHAPTLPEGGPADVVIRFDPTYLANDVFADPNPSATSASSIPADKTDAVSVIEHEIGHALGFVSSYGLDANSTADLGQRLETTFDPFVQFPDGNPVFTGPNAEATNDGNPIPLTHFPLSDQGSSQNITHLGTSPISASSFFAMNEPFGLDLMNGIAFLNGFRYVISPADLAIIDDTTGLTHVAEPPPPEPPPGGSMPAPPPPPPPPPPEMQRTFTGAVDTSAANPDNWSPTGSPQAGDALRWINGGTMDIAGNALAGDTIVLGTNINPPPASNDFVINVSGHSRFTEEAAFPPLGVGSITLNLADHAKWIGGFSSNLAGGVFITGDGKFANKNSVSAASSVVNADVVGHGSFRVSSAQSTSGALEFGKSVSKGQAVLVGGDPERGANASLIVDHPADYHASTTLGFGEIRFAGLTADSFSLKNDLLTLFAGSTVVDRFNLTLESAEQGLRNFGVSQTAAGVVVHADNFQETGTLLPMHTY